VSSRQCMLSLHPFNARDTVSNARIILVTLICALPVVLLLDGPAIQGLVAGVLAVCAAMVGRTIRPGESEFLISAAWPLAMIAAVPALWMLLQVVPVGSLAHPMWASAQAGLGRSITGTMSIDIGASVIALGQYLIGGATALMSAAVAVDRQRAEWLLFSLTGAATLIAVVLGTHDMFNLTFLSGSMAPMARAQALDCTALGVILATAAGTRTIERYETRRTSPDRSVGVLMLTFAACGTAIVVCLLTLIRAAAPAEIIATIFGVGALIVVAVVRRLPIGPWGIAAIIVPILALTAVFAATEPSRKSQNFLVAFAARSPPPLTALSQRMLEDAPFAGTGAGTFAAMTPIYREIDDNILEPTAPTAAIAVAVELGRSMLSLIVLATGACILILLKASTLRGRDSFYAATGAGSLIALLALSFMNPGPLGTTVTIMAGAILGLAIAQRKSRMAQA
jgi:hypothetical protein